MLGASEAESFVADGYVAIRGAVPADVVRACRQMIWSELAGRLPRMRAQPAVALHAQFPLTAPLGPVEHARIW